MESELSTTSDALKHEVFSADESHLPGTALCRADYVHTINSGTKAFVDSGAKAVIDKLQIFDTVGRLMEGPGDSSRGNVQWTFGVTGGECTLVLEEAEEILEQFGTTLPNVCRGTLGEDGRIKPEILEIFKAANALARILMVMQAMPGFMDAHPELKEELQIAEWLLTRKGKELRGTLGFLFASTTAIQQKIDPNSKTFEHLDTQNHPGSLCAVVCASETRELEDGSFLRRGFVFNGRKTLHDTRIRRGACKEKARPCVDFLRDLEEYRKPKCSLDRYFREGVGSEGLLLTQAKATGEIVGCALRSKAHMDKQGTYLASIVCAIMALDECKQIDRGTELLELLALVGNLCNIYIFVTVLGMMQQSWDPSQTSSSDGGMLAHVIGFIVRVTGCFNGGPGRRCMNFANKSEIPLSTFRQNCHAIADCFNRLMIKATTCLRPNSKTRRNEAHSAITQLSDKLSYSGELAASHVVHVMALFKAAPSYFLDHAIIAAGTSTNKKAKRPKMHEYLGIDEEIHEDDNQDSVGTGSSSKKAPGKKKGGAKAAARASKYTIVNRALVRVARVVLGDEYFTESQAENLGCEAHRDTTAYDLWFGGQGFFRKKTASCPFSEWEYMVPVLPDDYHNMGVDSALANVEFVKREVILPRNRTRTSSSEAAGIGSGCALWDFGVPDDKLAEEINMGRMPRKGSEEFASLEFVSTTIGRDILDKYPGLLNQIKVAMLARRDGKNSHRDVMERLNGIQDLRRAIREASEITYKRPAPASEGPRPKRRKTPTKLAPQPTEPVPVPVPQPTSLPQILDGEVLTLGMPREMGEMKLGYREFVATDEVHLASFAGHTKPEDFTGYSGPKSPSEPLSHAYSAISMGRKGAVPRLKLSKQQTKKSTGEKNIHVTSIRHENKELYRAAVGFLLPDELGVATVCSVRDKIAKTLGGTAVLDGVRADQERPQPRWHFRSELLAIKYLLICLVCVAGNKDSRKKLFNTVEKTVKTSNGLVRVMPVTCSYGVGAKKKAGKIEQNDDDEIWYYLMTVGEPGGKLNLVLAVPPASPWKPSATKSTKRQDDPRTTAFIRLM